jgi:hypothetical protein
MAMNTNPISERDPLLAVVDEFLTRFRRGEHPSVKDFIDRHRIWPPASGTSFPHLS